MKIKRVVSDLLDSNMYLIIQEDHMLVIDPCRDTSHGKDYHVDAMILTHEHYDHISGVNLWKSEYDAPVWCSQLCGQNCRDPKKNMSRHFEAFSAIQTFVEIRHPLNFDKQFKCEPDFMFKGEIEFIWRGNQIVLMELPGHSAGSIGILINSGHFFSGDSMWRDREVELGFPGGSKRDWNGVSVPKLAALRDGIMIYPGHEEPFMKGGGV